MSVFEFDFDDSGLDKNIKTKIDLEDTNPDPEIAKISHLINKDKLTKDEVDEINFVYRKSVREADANWAKYNPYFRVDPEIGSVVRPAPYEFKLLNLPMIQESIRIHKVLELEEEYLNENGYELSYNLFSKDIQKSIAEVFPEYKLHESFIEEKEKQPLDPDLQSILDSINSKYQDKNLEFNWVEKINDTDPTPVEFESIYLTINNAMTKISAKTVKSLIDGIKSLNGDEDSIKQTIIELISVKIDALF
jgi:hypothetical protein